MANISKYKEVLEKLWDLHVLQSKSYQLYEDQQRVLREMPRAWKEAGKILGKIDVEPPHHLKPIHKIKNVPKSGTVDASVDKKAS